MKLVGWFRIMCAVASILALASCGGGSSAASGGIGGTGKPVIKVGAVTATGGLTVGGQSFSTLKTTVTIGGAPAVIGDVKVGMVALVRGTDDSGAFSADDVSIEEAVKGILEAKIDANTVVVQGQTIQIDDATVFGLGISPASEAGLSVGDPLEVYGFVRSAGVVLARRIEREAGLSEFRLLGFATAVNTGAQTFMIGTQVIDYSSADTSDLSGADPVDGQLLELRALNTLSPTGEVVATEVKAEDLDDENDNDDTEIEGFVSAVNSPTQFVVGSVVVNTGAGTVFDGGTAAEIVVGARVEVEGALAMGVLAADKVAFKDSVKVESDVDTVVGNMITLVGLPGLTIVVNSITEYDGAASGIADIIAGDHIKVRGRSAGAATVTATCVEETGPDANVELRGPLDALPAPSDPTFSMLGVVIDTTGLPFSAFEGPGDTAIGRLAFFAAIVGGTVVEVEGDLDLGAAVWEKVEFEDDD